MLNVFNWSRSIFIFNFNYLAGIQTVLLLKHVSINRLKFLSFSLITRQNILFRNVLVQSKDWTEILFQYNYPSLCQLFKKENTFPSYFIANLFSFFLNTFRLQIVWYFSITLSNGKCCRYSILCVTVTISFSFFLKKNFLHKNFR